MSYPQVKLTVWRSNYNKTLYKRYQIVINTWARRKRKSLDLTLYAEAIQPDTVLRLFRQNETLSVSKEKKTNRKNWLVLIASLIVAMQGSDTAAAAKYSVDHLKLYAHSRLLSYVEFQCFNKIITKESRWSYTARNGSHYGLGQMRSKHYRDLDPYRQIDATIRYNVKRYGNQCNAWAFHQLKGYY